VLQLWSVPLFSWVNHPSTSVRLGGHPARSAVDKHCNHNIPETKKGAGPCHIKWEVKKRNGKPNWWCHTHGLDASAPDGRALDECSGAWFDATPAEMQIDVDATDGEMAVWGSIGPALKMGQVPKEPGKVHVHHRPTAGGKKDVDESFDIVTVSNGDSVLVVEGMAAKAFAISELTGMTVTPLTCPHCGEVHIDELMFATNPHIKHLCNSCGRNFRDQTPSVSNPLGGAQERLGLPAQSEPVHVDRPLELSSGEHSGIAMWPSNRAIVSAMARPEDEGIHVHTWDANGDLDLDDTYSPVVLDGEVIDEVALRLLAVQRELARQEDKPPPVMSLACVACGQSILSPTEGWMQASTHHVCDSCGADNRTRRKSFLNPLAEKG
jgi:predicted RNA-binding Zn-ribbon protein involved in translation (DUF1610 family)